MMERSLLAAMRQLAQANRALDRANARVAAAKHAVAAASPPTLHQLKHDLRSEAAACEMPR